MTADGALRNVRVVEVGQLIAGPFCGHLFADHGAEVIKVEPPGEGDVMRRWGGMYKGLGLYWPVLAREKNGFGAIGEGMGGFRHLSGEPGRAPVRVGVSIGDALAATHGFIGALL